MSEEEVRVPVEGRIIIMFLASEEVIPTEILEQLLPQFGENIFSRTRAFAWHKGFSGGHEEVENLSHECRARTSVIAGNVEAIRKLI